MFGVFYTRLSLLFIPYVRWGLGNIHYYHQFLLILDVPFLWPFLSYCLNLLVCFCHFGTVICNQL